MKHFHFEPETDGFYGAYWENTTQTDAALIVMLGDDPEDHMCKACVRWLQNDGFNVLSMSPAKKCALYVSRQEKLQSCKLSAGTD